MLLNGDDGLSLAAKTYRHQKIEDLRNNHVSWLVSCVLYAYSALCFLIVAVFASYGLIWPIRNKTRMVLPESRRKGTVSRHQQVHYGPQRFSNAVRRYWGSLRWFSIPATVGFAYVCYQQFWHIREREQRKLRSREEVLQNQWQVALFKKLPTRACSRAWGKVCDIYLPIWLRRPVIGIYAWLFCCNVAEATEEELINYPSLGTFFRRQLKPEARLICKKSSIVSPVDGSVLHYGVVENDQIEQVKGITYSMKTFLGPDQPSQASLKKLESSDNNRLHHCVIYLGPGDYHSFHSPTEWTTCLRRHFPGDLFSVHPGFARMISGLFNHNERVVLIGTWKYGFFSFTAVGAYNVGSINLKFDKDLKTNCPGSYEPGSFCEIEYTIKEGQGVPLLRGEKMGAFNLGSTIVLIFEAPKDFEFNIQPGQKLKYGEPIGSCRDEKLDNNL